MKHLLIIFLLAGFLNNYEAQTFNFRNYSEDEGLPQAYVYDITQFKNGFLGIATGKGFSMFDGSRFLNYSVQGGLADNFVTTVFCDSKEVIWLGHFQNGISYIKNGKTSKIKTGVFDELKINQFIEDKFNNIWIASLGGVFKLDSNYKLQAFANCKEPVNSFSIDNDNDLLCATNNGLMVIPLNGKGTEDINWPEDLKDKTIRFIIPGNYTHTVFWVVAEGEGIYGIRKMGREYSSFIHIHSELQSTVNKISSIFKDRNGDLWVGLFGEGVRKISFLKSDNYRYSVSRISKENGLKNEYIQSIFEDHEGNLWFGTFGEGLIEKPIEKFSFYNTSNGLKESNIHVITADDQNRLWLGNDTGFSYFNPKNSSVIHYTQKNGFVNDRVNALFADKGERLWIGTENSGIYILDQEKEKIENFSKSKRLHTLSINCITRDKNGIIVIGTDDGILRYDPENKTITELNTLQGLLHNNVVHLFVDSKNRLWISSHGAPPYYYSDGKFTVLKNVEGLRSYNINSVTEDRNKNIWIATEGDGVFKYDGTSFVNYRTEEGLLSNYCYSVANDKNNMIWISHKNGLSSKRKDQLHFRSYTKAESLLFVENNLNATYKDHEGNIWFGTTKGLVHFNSESEKQGRSEPKLSITDIAFNKIHYKTNQHITKTYSNYHVKITFIGVSLARPEMVHYRYRLLGLDTSWHNTSNHSVEYPKLNDGHYIFQVATSNDDERWTSEPAQLSFEIGLPVWKQGWFFLFASFAISTVAYLVFQWRTGNLRKSKEILETKVKEKTHLLQREKETVEKIKVELEEKNKDVTDSINYAKRIQEAMLPAWDAILEKLPDSFLLYQPRDIVSGDFYWFHETDDHYIIAAIDCTGHGVPGAFMSLIGSTLLNEIVGQQILLPSQILKHLNEKITSVLHQERENASAYDGMDMAICSISKKKQKCIFAGAPRPLYHIREGILSELKGTAASIGGHDAGSVKDFTDHEIEIKDGDMLYMFSDGYTDQFNSNLHKKFSTRRLKDLLNKIHFMPGPEQCEKLRQEFKNWSGTEEQLDDILVIGIRV